MQNNDMKDSAEEATRGELDKGDSEKLKHDGVAIGGRDLGGLHSEEDEEDGDADDGLGEVTHKANSVTAHF